MPNRYNTSNSQLKVTAGKGPKNKPAGSSPAVSYDKGTWAKLPGQAGKERTLGVKKVKTYCHSVGV